jgi:hypothetical protein
MSTNFEKDGKESLNKQTTVPGGKLKTVNAYLNKGQQDHVNALESNDNAPRMLRYFSNYISDHGAGLVRRRTMTINTSFVQHNMIVMENSCIPDSGVKLGFTSTRNFLIGCFMLLLMVIPCSIIGPMTISLPAKNVYVQASWRFQGCTVLAIPIMLALYLYKGREMSIRDDFSLAKLKMSMVNSFLIFLWNLGFILGCSLTITSHADIMYGSGGVYLFIIGVVT